MDVKKKNKYTLANCLSLELGSLEVVTMILGSSTPAHLYSSSLLDDTPENEIVCLKFISLLQIYRSQKPMVSGINQSLTYDIIYMYINHVLLSFMDT